MRLPHIFHKWADATSVNAARQFIMVEKCTECGLIRQTNILFDEILYFHLKETTDEPAN